MAAAQYLPPDVHHFDLPARSIDEVFRLSVRLPARAADESERFPVVYATDSNEYFAALSALTGGLEFSGDVRRFILVGIGYQRAAHAGLLRMRDFYPASVRALFKDEIASLAGAPLSAPGLDLGTIHETTDASHFLRFIEEEVTPFVNERYPATHDTCYFGYSSGGAFGLHALFQRSKAFAHYILASPATKFAGVAFALDWARRCAASATLAPTTVFMSVGEREEHGAGLQRFQMLSSAVELHASLRNLFPRLNTTLRILPGEGHATAWSGAFTRGLRHVIGGDANVPFWPSFYRPAQ